MSAAPRKPYPKPSLQPLDVAPLFRPLLAELLSLLRGLQTDHWDRQTVAPQWRVRDVAAHLLDGDLRKIAVYRDDHQLPMDAPIRTEADLSRFINGLNAGGVAWAARLSPRLLVDLLEVTGAWVAEVIEALPPHGPARFPVSWAGEAASENWMDTGREYTERWHHQAQIREAVGALLLLERRWMDPLLEFSVRALPHGYAQVEAPEGTTVVLDVHGPTTGAWTLERTGGSWRLFQGAGPMPATTVRVFTDDAWRLFYNALPAARLAGLEVVGDRRWAEPLLRTRSVIL